jgi:DUF2075 family protein
MIVYQSTAAGFRDDCFRRSIRDVVTDAFSKATRRQVGEAEANAWANSLQQVAVALNDEAIPGDAGIAIEYTLPQSSKRVDLIVSGYGDDQRPALIIIELKQWSSSTSTLKDGVILARRGGRNAESEGPHPSYQAWSYAQLLKGFNEAVYEADMQLMPCAYLHNHPADGTVDGAFYKAHIDQAPLFLKGDAERQRLRQFIAQHIRYGDSKKIIEIVENGRIRPSKALAESLVRMINGQQEFVLIDQQKVVRESVIAIAASASPEEKRVVIIRGGPGTGKSVVAINLLVEMTRRGLLTKYVSKNAAPRAVYAAKLAGTLRRTEISNLFSGSGAFVDTEANVFDVLVVDEAHRLNEKSGLYGNLGDHQIKELIRSAKCAVFFIDERQRVTLSDIGTVSTLREMALTAGATVHEFELESQFRCSGSDGYVAWVDQVLGVRETANSHVSSREYDFRVVDTAGALHELIELKNRPDNKARVVAGYCWDWASKKDPSAYDITLDGGAYQRRWNLDVDGSLWIVAPGSVEQVGCIHTCQGLEVDYIGVIIGPDLVVRDGQVKTLFRERARADRRKSLSGIQKMLKQDRKSALEAADEIIKNTYRTLMTRGMKGCYVFSQDAETRRHFKSKLAVAAESGAWGT